MNTSSRNKRTKKRVAQYEQEFQADRGGGYANTADEIEPPRHTHEAPGKQLARLLLSGDTSITTIAAADAPPADSFHLPVGAAPVTPAARIEQIKQLYAELAHIEKIATYSDTYLPRLDLGSQLQPKMKKLRKQIATLLNSPCTKS